MSNAALGVGAVNVASDMIDELLGSLGVNAPMLVPGGMNPVALPPTRVPMMVPQDVNSVSDFVTLNDYVNAPGRATPYGTYKDVYQM